MGALASAERVGPPAVTKTVATLERMASAGRDDRASVLDMEDREASAW